MKQAIFLAGAGLALAAAPAAAKPGNGHGNSAHHGDHSAMGHVGYGTGGCPPGLAKKGCVPPGQAKKMFNVGQRFRSDYGRPYNYNQLPYDLRQQYNFDPRSRYYYGDGYLYRVDPKTMLVQQAIAALLR